MLAGTELDARSGRSEGGGGGGAVENGSFYAGWHGSMGMGNVGSAMHSFSHSSSSSSSSSSRRRKRDSFRVCYPAPLHPAP
jgi:hypothetical protein